MHKIIFIYKTLFYTVSIISVAGQALKCLAVFLGCHMLMPSCVRGL